MSFFNPTFLVAYCIGLNFLARKVCARKKDGIVMKGYGVLGVILGAILGYPKIEGGKLTGLYHNRNAIVSIRAWIIEQNRQLNQILFFSEHRGHIGLFGVLLMKGLETYCPSATSLYLLNVDSSISDRLMRQGPLCRSALKQNCQTQKQEA